MANRSRRIKPIMAKAGVSRDSKRRYCGGGKLYSKGGKLKKKCK